MDQPSSSTSGVTVKKGSDRTLSPTKTPHVSAAGHAAGFGTAAMSDAPGKVRTENIEILRSHSSPRQPRASQRSPSPPRHAAGQLTRLSLYPPQRHRRTSIEPSRQRPPRHTRTHRCRGPWTRNCDFSVGGKSTRVPGHAAQPGRDRRSRREQHGLGGPDGVATRAEAVSRGGPEPARFSCSATLLVFTISGSTMDLQYGGRHCTSPRQLRRTAMATSHSRRGNPEHRSAHHHRRGMRQQLIPRTSSEVAASYPRSITTCNVVADRSAMTSTTSMKAAP